MKVVKLLFFFLITMLLMTTVAYAGVAETILEAIGPMIGGFAEKYPVIFQIIFVMGSARLIIKPLMSLVLVIVETTPSKSDDTWYAGLQESPIYKFIIYLLDWSTSIKLPKVK